MKKNYVALSAALTLTAIVLGAFILADKDQPAQANMLNSTPEYSLMTAGPAGVDESLIIVDKNAQKMIVYKLVNARDLNVMAGYDLAK